MFKITNAQLIQIAAVDAGLDPFAEYCTKGVYKANGYTVKKGAQPVLTLDLWCPRQAKGEQAETLSNEPAQQDGNSSVSHMFFQFKTCHLFCRSQVVSAEEIQQEKEAVKFRKAQQKAFKSAVKSMGGIAPNPDYLIPQWCQKSSGLALDVAVDEISAAGYVCQDSEGLFSMLAAM